jgi:hypothetical protein
MSEMYGWYSQKQYENLKKVTEEDGVKANKYYLDMNDKIVQVTEVTSNNIFQSHFDDAICIGKLKQWHGHYK